MRIAVIGSNGQLGSDLVREFAARGDETTALTHSDIEVGDYRSVESLLQEIGPNVVLNTAAFHVVQQCESDPHRAFQVNALGALNIAKVCEQLKAVSVFFSTDYVFSGAKQKPYVETDPPCPLNMYGGTKLLGEYYTLDNARESLVLRVSGLYGSVPCRAKGGNFISTMLKASEQRSVVKVVRDEILTPTPTSEIASKTYELIMNGVRGLVHLTCEGECSWYEFARVIFDTLNLRTPLEPCSANDFPSTVKRPLYSVLENQRMKDLHLGDMPHWEDALVRFLKHLQRSSAQ